MVRRSLLDQSSNIPTGGSVHGRGLRRPWCPRSGLHPLNGPSGSISGHVGVGVVTQPAADAEAGSRRRCSQARHSASRRVIASA